MKSLAIFALSAIASASALAVTPIDINGTLTQTTTVGSAAAVTNTAQPNSTAIQNVSSNKGQVTLASAAHLTQTSTLGGSTAVTVKNEAKNAGDIAVQNISSNYGTPGAMVDIQSGTTTQTTNVTGGSSLTNTAEGGGSNSNQQCHGDDCKDGAQAVQNVSSNAVDVRVRGNLTQNTSIGGSTVSNLAKGKDALAQQSIASNFHGVTIGYGTTNQTASITRSVVTNEANGQDAKATQSLASNVGTNNNLGRVRINGNLDQTTTLVSSEVTNRATSKGTAIQNLASNFNGVTTNGAVNQQVILTDSHVHNTADGQYAKAQQNLASNADNVTTGSGGLEQKVILDQNSHVSNIAHTDSTAVQSLASNENNVTTGGGKVTQTVSMHSANISNSSTGAKAVAVQNLASNYGSGSSGGVNITAKLTQLVDGTGTVSNTAFGPNAQAFQNLASNLGKVTIAGATTQTVHVGGSMVNWAGANAVAMQNFSSNDACDPPTLKAPPTITMPSCPTGGCGWTVAHN